MSPDSPAAIESRLIHGFVKPGTTVVHGQRKKIAARLRARMFAAELGLEYGPRFRQGLLADQLGVSERNLARWFATRESLFAFPPPELATAIGEIGASSPRSSLTNDGLGTLFADLEKNPDARGFFSSLVELRRRHPELVAADNYFATAMTMELEGRSDRSTLEVAERVSCFTIHLRAALTSWADHGGAIVSPQPEVNDFIAWVGKHDSEVTVVVEIEPTTQRSPRRSREASVSASVAD